MQKKNYIYTIPYIVTIHCVINVFASCLFVDECDIIMCEVCYSESSI